MAIRRSALLALLILAGLPRGVFAQAAQLTSPAPNSTLTATAVPFQWTAGVSVTQYWLYVGTTPGSYNLRNQDQGTNLTVLVAGLPANGVPLYVRLWSLLSGNWVFSDYTITAADGRAQLTTPVPNTTLTATTVGFEWTGGINVTQYWLYVGTTLGGAQLLNQDQGTSLTASVIGLPIDGGPVYVRLWSLLSGNWVFNDYTLTALNSRAQLTTPAPNSTLAATAVTFQWVAGINVTQYWLYVGTTPGSSNLLNQDEGTNLTASVTSLPANGVPLYVRLWSLLSGNWVFIDYTVTAADGRAQLTTPTPNSALTATSVAFQWTAGINVAQYWLYVGTTPGSSDVRNQDLGTSLTTPLTGLPVDGSTLYVRLWSLLSGNWVFNDYTVTAANGQAQLTTPVPNSTLTATTVDFQWTAGINVTQYWLYVGTTPGSSNLRNQDLGTNLTTVVSGLPANGASVYVRLWSLAGGAWLFSDYTLVSVTSNAHLAQLTSPVPGSTLSATTVNFQWTGGVNMSQDRLQIWTPNSWISGTCCSTDDQIQTTLSKVVTGLPSDSRSTIQVRLSSRMDETKDWEYNDYTLTAATIPSERAALTTPAPNSVLSATTVAFQWTGGTDVTRYWLHVGTSLGGYDLYNQDAATNLTATVTGLPSDGRTLYVRLWGLRSAGYWEFTDYTLTAAPGP